MCFRPADASEMKQICKSCWEENPQDAEVCIHCGAELKKMRPIPGGTPGKPGAPQAPGAPAAPAPPKAPQAD